MKLRTGGEESRSFRNVTVQAPKSYRFLAGVLKNSSDVVALSAEKKIPELDVGVFAYAFAASSHQSTRECVAREHNSRAEGRKTGSGPSRTARVRGPGTAVPSCPGRPGRRSDPCGGHAHDRRSAGPFGGLPPHARSNVRTAHVASVPLTRHAFIRVPGATPARANIVGFPSVASGPARPTGASERRVPPDAVMTESASAAAVVRKPPLSPRKFFAMLYETDAGRSSPQPPPGSPSPVRPAAVPPAEPVVPRQAVVAVVRPAVAYVEHHTFAAGLSAFRKYARCRSPRSGWCQTNLPVRSDSFWQNRFFFLCSILVPCSIKLTYT